MSNKTKRELIKNKFGGLCAYSGTPLEYDWQAEHIVPVYRDLITKEITRKQNDNFDNIVPVQKIINHYKHSLNLENFRNWYLGHLHTRLKKLPKKTKSIKVIKRKEYLKKVASYFGIDENTPFSGKFYFEK
jgi:hypothetical protein